MRLKELMELVADGVIDMEKARERVMDGRVTLPQGYVPALFDFQVEYQNLVAQFADAIKEAGVKPRLSFMGAGRPRRKKAASPNPDGKTRGRRPSVVAGSI